MVRGALFGLLILASLASLGLVHSHLPLAILIYALGTALTLVLLFHPRIQWLVTNRSRVQPNCVALTFDDGPDPVHTPRLLDLLREKNVKATFFVVGERARQHPEIVRRAWLEGHLIANHTWSHPNLFCFLTPRRLMSEIEQTSETIQSICGTGTRLFRSPVGLRHPLLSLYLTRLNLEFISWRVRSFDTLIKSPASLASRILNHVAGGDIILLHDRLPRGTDAMLKALPGVINELRQRGFEFVLAGPREDQIVPNEETPALAVGAH